MRSEGQIRQQLKQVVYRHLQKRLRENFRQRPNNCAHNVELALDDAGSYVGLCGLVNAEGKPRHVPCDARIQGCSEMARQCPLFRPLLTKDEVKAEFNAIIQSEDRGVIASHFPDVAALLWVLDQPGILPTEEEIADLAEKAEEKPEPPHGWWGGLMKKWGGGG